MFDLFRTRNAQTNLSGSPRFHGGVADLTTEDLPCPWCRAETHEGDVRCTSCGRRFG